MISTQEKVKNLQQAITKEDSQKIFEIAKELLKEAPNDEEYQECYAISGIKSKKYDELASTLFKQQPTSPKLNQLYFYYLYSSAQYQKCIALLQPRKINTNLKLLLAQSYFNNLEYSKCVDLLAVLIKQSKLTQEERETYLIDILAACSSQQSASSLKEYSYQINATSCKELFYNYALCLFNVGDVDQSLKYLNMFEGALTKEKEDEIDWITVKLFRDYIKMRSHEEHSEKMWDEKIEEYESMLKNDKDENLKCVLLNNLLFLKQIYGEQQNHNYKILDEVLDPLKNKLSQSQRYNLRLNKITLLLRKSKVTEALKLIHQLESVTDKKYLYLDFEYVRNKYFALKKSKQFQAIEQIIKDLEPINENLSFCLAADLAREKGDNERMLKKLKDSTNWDNQVLKNYNFSLLIKDETMFEKYSEYLGELALKSNEISILEILLKIYENKSDLQKQKNILNKILSIDSHSISTKIKLAEMYLNEGQSKKAEEMLRGIEMPEEVTDLNYLQYIEKNIHISKKEETIEQEQDFKKQAHKKRIKKKKRVRYPKNMEKVIENFKGDPERWLPKWQRKGYKKKGKKANKTQGMVMVGKQEKNSYATGASTSAKEVTKDTKKRR